MPSCVNRVVLVGNLGADPDTRFTPSGTQVVTANLATDNSWTDRQGIKRQRTEWHRLVFWRRLAEIATEYLEKGSRIHVEGRLQSRSWEDGDGHRHFVTEIVASDLKILDGPADGPAELDLLYGREQLQGSDLHESDLQEGQIREGALDDVEQVMLSLQPSRTHDPDEGIDSLPF